MKNSSSGKSAALAIDGAISRLVRDLTAAPLPAHEERSRALALHRATRESTLAIIQDLTQAQADFFPAKGVWSIGQNIGHLLLTDGLYRTWIQRLVDASKKGGARNIVLTFREIDNSVAFIPRDVIPKLILPLNVMNLFVPRALRETLFRVPLIPGQHPSSSEPEPSQPIEALRAEAASSLLATEEIFRANLPPGLMKTTLSHPVLGTNNVAQLLRILAAHEERHHGQIRRVLAHPRFPRSQPVIAAV